MIIALIILTIGITVWFETMDFEELTIIPLIIIVLELLAFIILCIEVSGLKVIDTKIEMYTEENQKIESQMSDLVQSYMEYEGNTFKDFKSESSVTLVNLYPELKSDALVQKQLDMYIANNEKIKELKTSEINGKVYRWWLYFGGRK